MPPRPTSAQRPKDFVEGLSKGLAIIECFGADNAEMTLSEVARRVGISPSAARRGLITLQTLGYVGQADRHFYLKPKVMGLGSAFYSSARIDEVLQPELRSFVETFGDASSVATLEGFEVLYIAHYSEQRARRPAATVGARYPAQVTSLGRVMLAGLSDDELGIFLQQLRPVALTAKTVTDRDELRALIEQVRAQQYATTVDQLDYGITALAVPILGTHGRTVAALNTSGYSGAVTAEDLVEQRLPALREAAARISNTFRRYPVIGRIIEWSR